MIKYLVITVALVASAFLAEIALLSKGGEEIERAFENFEKTPRPIKTLIIGHCQASSGIAPAYVGSNVFNFAINDMNYFYTRKMLEQVINKSDLESVVLAINPLMFMGRYKLPPYTQRYLWLRKGIAPPLADLTSVALSFGNHAKLFNDEMNRIFFKEIVPVNHHLTFSSDVTTAPLQEIKQDTYYLDGFRALTPSFESDKKESMLEAWMKNFDFSDEKSEIHELELILTILKNTSTKTTLLLLPQVAGMQELIEIRKPGTEKKLQDTLSFIRKQFPDARIHDLRSGHNIPDQLFAEPNLISSKGADILGLQLRKILNAQK
ncbi:MAG: hypothetical protein V4598_14025 [Bdellovibrionota bacterium]